MSGADSEIFVVKNGSVGIGTTNPAQKLQVIGNIAIADSAWIGVNEWHRISFCKGNSDILDIFEYGAITFTTGSGITERMRIKSTGEVGIGTTNPTTKLEVDGVVTATSFTGSASGLTNVSSSGSYTGDNTINRAIAHGLGTTPSLILLFQVDSWERQYSIFAGVAKIYDYCERTNNAVTAPDATNFYVGNSSNYERAANYSGFTYRWVAFR